MNRNKTLFCLILSLVSAASCNTAATTNSTVNINVNTKANADVAVTDNRTIIAPQFSPVANNAISRIPSANVNFAVSKEDPTRNVKLQIAGRPAPDNSEVITSLAKDITHVRTFKNNARLAKIEVTDGNQKTVKVYLRNGQVRELSEGKVGDPLSESADNILRAIASSGAAAQTKTETKALPTKPDADKSGRKLPHKLVDQRQ